MSAELTDEKDTMTTTTRPGLKVIRLTAENVKRLKAVEITPDQTMQIITGRNAQGKTSVLAALWLALGGGSAAPAGRGFQIGHRQTMLGHHGLDLGDHAGALRGAEFLDGAGNFFLLLAQFFLLGAQVLESRHGRGIPRRSSTCSARSMPELPAGTEIFQA